MIDLRRVRQQVMRTYTQGGLKTVGDVMDIVARFLADGRCKSIAAYQFHNEKTHVHFQFKVVTDDWYVFGFDIFDPSGITLPGVIEVPEGKVPPLFGGRLCDRAD